MRMRTLRSLLLVATGVLAVGCAGNQAAASGAGLAPLATLDCYEVGDVYSQVTYDSYVNAPCTGFVYGDYEQYPNFTPTRQVILSSDRNHQTRIVMRPGFDGPGNSNSSYTNSSSFADSPNVSSVPSATSGTPPRMDPVVVSAPAERPVISRQ
ncbi:MAG TPA: hypothetical protein VJA66_11270 [Thermoanaerobaculia bacterium]